MKNIKKFLLSTVFCLGVFGGVSDGYAGGGAEKSSYILKDDGIYLRDEKLENSDPSSFEYIDSSLVKDKNHVYFESYIIEDAIPQSFEVIYDEGPDSWYKDENNLYNRSGYIVKKYEGLNPNTFEINIEDMYIKDKDNVYVIYGYDEKFRKVENADPQTFQAIDIEGTLITFFKDKNHLYYKENVVTDADSETFKVLGGVYFSDKESIFYEKYPNILKINDVDINTFSLVETTYTMDYAKDKNTFYKKGEKIIYDDLPEEVKNKYSKETDLTNIFSDTATSHKNYPAINFVKEQGFVKGYEINGESFYKPEQKINRAEFTKIILLTKYSQAEISEYQKTIAADKYFSDVKTGDWFAEYVNFAKKEGILKGYTDGTFGVAKDISFAEASKIVANVLMGGARDLEEGEEWFVPFVEKVRNSSNKISGYSEIKNITRGEMAEIIYGVME